MEGKRTNWVQYKVEAEPTMFWPVLGGLVGALLVQFIPALADQTVQAVVNFVVVGGPVLAGLIYARSKTTSMAHPRTDEKKPAVIVSQEHWNQLDERVRAADMIVAEQARMARGEGHE